jgi:hypothetical protein
VDQRHWRSEDGRVWDNEEAGDPASGADFADVRVLLVGGPRGGVIVV